ncbi:sensor histidine kinase [Pelotalea chapellei]|uniref:histidine kinase n=1 Tax=Pelotalea chapellei TaxID=44671 RepID=A0ABS5UB08_9BACT|nr:PAS domain S-box protein [Pelotalea chapellei]MBT1072866.1 PAS domain S-box protein [Pelotalea chapellei]
MPENNENNLTLLEKLFENAPDATVVVDKHGVIRKVNRQTEMFFDYRRDELIGRHVEVLIPKRFRKHHRNYRRGYFDDPRTRHMGVGLDLFGRTRQGVEIPVDIMLSFIEINEETLAFAVIRDVTQAKLGEARIKELNVTLLQHADQMGVINRELESFSYSVSHDLRAPLRAMDGFSQALLEDYGSQLDQEGQNYLQRIRAASQNMGALIDQLLMLSRLSRTEMHLGAVNLTELAEKIVDELREQDPDIRAEFIIRPGMIGFGDAPLLKVALANLLGNACKFSSKRESPRIEFGSESGQNGETVYFVKDNGAGFNPDYADNLFQPFQRLHGAHEFSGTGIGLATVLRVINRHGGRIWATGEPDVGAIFHFTLGTGQP